MRNRTLDALEGAPPGVERALELAWESYQRGCVPVGAVVVDDGVVVAEGRNQISDVVADDRGLAGRDIAHAELSALASLGRRRPGVHLISTLEPCPMCASAALLMRVDRLRYLAPDPCFGVGRFPDLRGRIDDAGQALTAHDAPLLATFAGAMVLELMIRKGGFAAVVARWQDGKAVDRLARRLLAGGRLEAAAAAGVDLRAVIAEIDVDLDPVR